MKNVWKSPTAGAALIILLTVAAYTPVMRAGFIWDDETYVTENPRLRSLAGLEAIWFKPGATIQYYPLVFTSFWAEYHLWGLRPFGYHLVNVLLHAINAVLLWHVLRRLEVPGAWWAAAVFALHPVNVESVAWITERKNTLSGLFYLLAALAWLRFRPLTDGETDRAPDWRFYWLATGLFVCALFSKTVTCSLPAVLVLLIWWKTGRLERRDGLALAPWFGFGIASGFITRWLEHRAGAHGTDWELTFVQRCLLAGRALWFYAGKLFWPHPLTFIYPRWEINPSMAWQYLFPVAAFAVVIALWLLRSRIGKGPLVGVLFFVGTLAPALGFFDLYPFRYTFVADHFQYLACIGLITLTASVATTVSRRASSLATLAATTVLMMLAVCTWTRAHVYHDLETLWRDTLTMNPGSWMVHSNLGVVLQGAGRTEEAIAQYDQTLRINPNDTDALCNLALAFLKTGRLPEAIEHYEQALRVDPTMADVHLNLGAALEQAGRPTEAMAHYEQALKINPNYAEAHNNLGNMLAHTGKVEEAITHYEQAARLKPDYAESHNNLGLALVRLGRVPEGVDQYEQALQINPRMADAHYNLAVALAQEGRLSEAMGHYEQALKINPDFAEAHNNLAVILSQTGKFEQAINHYQQALRIKPDYADAHYNLGVVLEQLGRREEAIAQYEQMLRIRPDFAEAKRRLERLRAAR